ncbi:hypothetical protein [Bosea sp. (in: a-proteobacteria)]|jgi:hypothetical protein|uniref:hypothetical protein n=1 Tax=Bosea sp. (in: a-proteobacteria) TaxID=1871050 RepID=UPI003F6EBD73
MSISASIDLEPGQVWTYHNAPDVDSRVTIGRIDVGEHDAIISIAISRALPHPVTPRAEMTDIGHLPIRQAALLRSLHQHLGNGPVPDRFNEGYLHWRELYDSGRAGAFDTDLAKAIEFVLSVTKTGARRPL